MARRVLSGEGAQAGLGVLTGLLVVAMILFATTVLGRAAKPHSAANLKAGVDQKAPKVCCMRSLGAGFAGATAAG